jgi:hypothetical protein
MGAHRARCARAQSSAILPTGEGCTFLAHLAAKPLRDRLFQADRQPRTSRLLSCRRNRLTLIHLVRHRRLSFCLLVNTLFPRCNTLPPGLLRSGAPCTLPRSSTARSVQAERRSSAASDPSGRMSPSDSRGSFTGMPAWSAGAATGKIACVPLSLVCTFPHPPKRSSFVHMAAVNPTRGCIPSALGALMHAPPEACAAWRRRASAPRARPRPGRRHRTFRRSTWRA